VKRLKVAYIPAVLLGSFLASTPTCLPKNYFAISTRNLVVAFADTILGNLVQPIFDTIVPQIDNSGNTGN